MKSNSAGELARIFLRLGATAFGGPLAHVGLMRGEFVDRRKWFTSEEFLDLFGAVNLLPGPSSTQLAMYIGYRRGGPLGLLAAGVAFIFPAFLLVLGLATLYARYGTVPASRALLWGVAPVVVAVVAQALLGFAPKALASRRAKLVAAAGLAAMAWGASPTAIILAAGLLGLGAALAVGPRQVRRAASVLGLVPLSPSALKVFLVFLKIGCLVYGSGYVLLAYLRSDLVGGARWITDRQLLDSIAVGQVTPGPVFTTATFLGFQIAGLPGAILATLGIFGPSFLLVWGLAALFERWRNSPRLRGFLDVVNAASLALMAGVTWELASSAVWTHGHVDVLAAYLGLAAMVALLRYKVNSAWLLGAGALLGLLLGSGRIGTP